VDYNEARSDLLIWCLLRLLCLFPLEQDSDYIGDYMVYGQSVFHFRIYFFSYPFKKTLSCFVSHVDLANKLGTLKRSANIFRFELRRAQLSLWQCKSGLFVSRLMGTAISDQNKVAWVLFPERSTLVEGFPS
jgi:hypothetical protein